MTSSGYPPVTIRVRSTSPSMDSDDGILLSPALIPSRTPSPPTPIETSVAAPTPPTLPDGGIPTLPPDFWGKLNPLSRPEIGQIPKPPLQIRPPACIWPTPPVLPFRGRSRSRSHSRSRSDTPPSMGARSRSTTPPPLRTRRERRVTPPMVIPAQPPAPMIPPSPLAPPSWPSMAWQSISPPPVLETTPAYQSWPPPPPLAPLVNQPRVSGMPPPLMYPGITSNSPKYFFTDGNVAFRAKNTIYKVHSHFFQQNSPVLATRIPTYAYSVPEACPIWLDDVTPQAFELLLSIAYPKDYTRYELETTEDWSTLLSLAEKYSMTKMRDLAIDRLTSIATPAEKIALAARHDIQEWFVPAYTELCLKLEPLTLEEGKKVGVEAVVKIHEMQHEIKTNLVKYLDMKKIADLVKTSMADEED